MMTLRLTKSYVGALGAIFIFFVTLQLIKRSSEPSVQSAAQSVGWRDWMWPSEAEDTTTVIKSTPPKFSRPPNVEGSIPKDIKLDAQQKWEEMVPSGSTPPAPENHPVQESQPVSEEPVESEVKGEDDEEKMMKEADCPSQVAWKADPLPALNTTFHVPDDIHYSPKGPDPSEVVIVTATDGKGHNGGIADILSQTAANRKSYCQYHGYNYHFVNISQYELDDAHPVWKKIPAIVDAFNTYPKAQWVFFLDLDAIIMSPKQDLNSLVLSHAGMSKALDFGGQYHGSEWTPLGVYMPEMHDVKFEDLDMLVAQDHNGVNAGSFFLRRSKFSQWLLDMWADPFFMRMNWPGQEQDTLLHFIKHHKVFRQHLGLIKQRTANAYVEGNEAMKWQPGDLVIHFAGCWVDDKCQEWWQEFWSKRGTLTSESY
ncbi:uncharacterized protein PV09_00246 [Verruconis gallopava]|uniref:Nucleotide-diphospho-sugar transferase domain-containing protein n=1 Tax=Verruconis gallopava TaxID=253628 RepID=A0A0D2AS27_9PEZI|nr:uncharacterized protein PV09_00246 [Verruconis gallopava]KIW09345.1 hypothetical protein PV09_00246 [Verruconis gallopava]